MYSEDNLVIIYHVALTEVTIQFHLICKGINAFKRAFDCNGSLNSPPWGTNMSV
jgi:hypothetical protein